MSTHAAVSGPALSSSLARDRAMRLLSIVFWVGLAASIVHYTDNWLNYERFPQLDGFSYAQHTVWLSWIGFAGAGFLGYLFYRRGDIRLGTAFLALFSVSGLSGIGHYANSDAFDMAWWRQVHVLLDFGSGVALFVFAVWSMRLLRRGALN